MYQIVSKRKLLKKYLEVLHQEHFIGVIKEEQKDRIDMLDAHQNLQKNPLSVHYQNEEKGYV